MAGLTEESCMIELDEFDRKILGALQRDGRMTLVALSDATTLVQKFFG